MRETDLKTGLSLTSEQKCAALEAVLHSQTFTRADQLKCFLKYICEMEMAGKGHELTEYLIGVEALGRPANYSPGDDSAVRTRAFALRKKLQEFYEREQPSVALRIELLKGSYRPHFVESQPHQKANGIETSAEEPAPRLVHSPVAQEDLGPAEATGGRAWKRSWLLPFGAGALLTALLTGGLYGWLRAKPASDPVAYSPAPILAEAWGPLLAPNADVLLCVANPPSFSILPDNSSSATTSLLSNAPGARPMPQQLYEFYATRYHATANLTLTLTTNATFWGDVLGALTAYKTLSAASVSPQMFPEMITTMPTLRNRNVIYFGAPSYSPAVARLLEKCPFQVNFLDSIVGAAPAARYALKRDQQQRLVQVFGLITVLPGESSADKQNRILIFSGVNSAGTLAAAEFFSSPKFLLELKRELKKARHETFPPAYQVVVRAETDDSILLNFYYETYRIIPTPTGN